MHAWPHYTLNNTHYLHGRELDISFYCACCSCTLLLDRGAEVAVQQTGMLKYSLPKYFDLVFYVWVNWSWSPRVTKVFRHQQFIIYRTDVFRASGWSTPHNLHQVSIVFVTAFLDRFWVPNFLALLFHRWIIGRLLSFWCFVRNWKRPYQHSWLPSINTLYW